MQPAFTKATTPSLISGWIREKRSEVGQMTLLADKEAAISSQSCWKAMKHITAPWACSFQKSNLESLTGTGKIQTSDKSGHLLLEHAIHFDPLGNFIKKNSENQRQSSPEGWPSKVKCHEVSTGTGPCMVSVQAFQFNQTTGKCGVVWMGGCSIYSPFQNL